MRASYWLACGLCVGALGFVAMPATAAPAGALADAMLVSPAETENAQKVHSKRRCWRHRGHWHCQRHARRFHRHYYDGYYPRRHYRYHGYRPGFGIHGPGFGFYFAPRHRRHWW